MRVAVIGTGLIGTSVALALREHGVSVWLADTDPEAARLAANLGAGEPLPDGAAAGRRRGDRGAAVRGRPPRWPPPRPAALAACYTDVASVKQLPGRQARALGCDLTSYVPRPPAGRPGEARPRGRPRRPVPGPALGAVPGPETSEHGRRPLSPRWSGLCGAVPVGSTRPPTTAGSRSSPTPRTWSPRRWRPGWRPRRPRHRTWPGRGCAT